MENEEKKETSLEYFYRRTRNNAINLDYQHKSLKYSIKMYEQEIEKAYNEGWMQAAKDLLTLNQLK
jgi:hypothetical protein